MGLWGSSCLEVYPRGSSMYGSQPCRGSTKWNMAERGNLPRRDFSPELWGPLSQRLLSSHGHVVKRRRGATR